MHQDGCDRMLDILAKQGFSVIIIHNRPLAVQATRGDLQVTINGAGRLFAGTADPKRPKQRFPTAQFEGVYDNPVMLEHALNKVAAWKNFGETPRTVEVGLNTPMDPRWSRAILSRPFRVLTAKETQLFLKTHNLWSNSSNPCLLGHDGVVVQCVRLPPIHPSTASNPFGNTMLVRLVAHPDISPTQILDFPFLADDVWLNGLDRPTARFAGLALKVLHATFSPPQDPDIHGRIGAALVRAGVFGKISVYGRHDRPGRDHQPCIVRGNTEVAWPKTLDGRPLACLMVPSKQGGWKHYSTLVLDLPTSAHASVRWLHAYTQRSESAVTQSLLGDS